MTLALTDSKLLSIASQVRADLDSVGHAITDGRHDQAVETIRHCIAGLQWLKLALTSPVCMTQTPRQEPLGNAESKKYRQNDTDYPLFT